MAVQQYFVAASEATTFGQMLNSAQTAASRTDGWTVAKLAATNMSDFLRGTKQASGTFVTSGRPSVMAATGTNAFKLMAAGGLQSGTYAATAWTIAFAVRAGTASSQAGRIRVRVYAADTNGNNVREITGSTQVGTTTGALSTTADVTSTVTWTPAAPFSINNEYIFIVIAWEVTTASGSNNGDVLIRSGSSGPAGSYVTTSNFSIVDVVAPTTNINATSTVSGSVSRQFLVAPAQIAATSTVSGGVARRFVVAPAQIAATSTVGGLISRARKLTTGQISATSTVSTIPVFPTGATGIWHLDDNTGTSAADSAGSHTGTLTGSPLPVWATGKLGSALTFDGSQNYVSIANASDLNAGTAFTCSAWVNPQSIPAADKVIASKWDYATQGGWAMELVGASGTNDLQIYVAATLTDAGGNSASTSGNLIGTGTWHHVAFVYDGSQSTDATRLKLYVDGVLRSASVTGSVPTSIPANSAGMRIGMWNGLGRYLKGSIDEVATWQRALSAAEIASLYNIGAGFVAVPVIRGVKPAQISATSTVGGAVKKLVSIVPSQPWAPSNLSGLGIWLDASQLGLADGASVSSWPNLVNGSAPGTVLHSPAPTYHANALGGLGVVHLLPYQGVIQVIGATPTTTFTLVYLAHMVTLGANAQRIGGTVYNASANSENAVLGWWSGNQDALFDGAWMGGSAPTTPATTNWKLYSFDKPGPGGSGTNPIRMFSDGTLLGSGTSGTMDLRDGFQLSGYEPAEERSDCEVAEVVIYNRVLSDVERQQVEAYLRYKWLGIGTPPIGVAISAISTVSGTVTIGATAGPKPITPGQISATSSVSGSVRALRKVAPGQISATSTMSGSVGARRVVTPTQISATSSVSGSIRALRRIAPTQISATSTVAGSISTRRAVLPAQILATSTASASVVARRAVAPAVIAATSTASGALRVVRAVRPTQISATSTVSGSISKGAVFKAITPATITASSTVSGSVAVRRVVLPAVINATSTASGSIRALRAVRPVTVLATSTVGGSVIVRRAIFPATILAISTFSGALKKLGFQPITGGFINAISTVAGNVIVLHRIGGNVTATSTVSAGIVIRRRLVFAQISATSTVSGSVTRARPIIPVTISATSTVSGKTIRFVAIRPVSILATSTVTGLVKKLVPIKLVQISATSTLAGSVRALRRVSALINATSTASGSVRILRRISPATVLAISSVSAVIRRVAVGQIQVAPIHATSVVTGAVFRYTPTVTYSHSGTGLIFDRVATGTSLVGSGELAVGSLGEVSRDTTLVGSGNIVTGKAGEVS